MITMALLLFAIVPTELEFELVHTAPLNLVTTIYVMVTNAGNVSAYAPSELTSGSATLVSQSGSTSTGFEIDGGLLEFPGDFTLVRPGEKLLISVWRGCQLKRGENQLTVRMEWWLKSAPRGAPSGETGHLEHKIVIE